MAVESDSDRDDMLSDWDSIIVSPGQTYPNRNDNTATINCIFENQYVLVSDVETLRPTAFCRDSDVIDVVHSSMVEKGTNKYKVSGIQPDGTGYTLLILEKQ